MQRTHLLGGIIALAVALFCSSAALADPPEQVINAYSDLNGDHYFCQPGWGLGAINLSHKVAMCRQLAGIDVGAPFFDPSPGVGHAPSEESVKKPDGSDAWMHTCPGNSYMSGYTPEGDGAPVELLQCTSVKDASKLDALHWYINRGDAQENIAGYQSISCQVFNKYAVMIGIHEGNDELSCRYFTH